MTTWQKRRIKKTTFPAEGSISKSLKHHLRNKSPSQAQSSYLSSKLIMSNFHHTCEIPSIRIDDGHILRCRVAREDGEYVDAEINLNSCIGNDNG